MIDYGTVRSTVRPDAVVVDEYSVWVHSSIKEIRENMGDGQPFDGYEYNMVQYDKNEYILMMSEKNDALEQQVAVTQMALCEIYETVIE